MFRRLHHGSECVNLVNVSNTTFKDDVWSWSQDATQLLFSSTRGRSPQFDVYRMNDDGTGVTRLTSAGSLNGTPDS